eukprot:jgi/Mesvir1/27215/Mv07059-RA.1
MAWDLTGCMLGAERELHATQPYEVATYLWNNDDGDFERWLRTHLRWSDTDDMAQWARDTLRYMRKWLRRDGEVAWAALRFAAFIERMVDNGSWPQRLPFMGAFNYTNVD